jgi:hypothetical protein
LSILIKSQNAYQGGSDWKTEEGLAFEMIVLSFPASYLAVGAMILAGYLQWFVFVPRLLRKTRRPATKDN